MSPGADKAAVELLWRCGNQRGTLMSLERQGEKQKENFWKFLVATPNVSQLSQGQKMAERSWEATRQMPWLMRNT